MIPKKKKNVRHNQTIDGTFFKINKKIKLKIKAKYHKINDWVMDPGGYFLIAIDKKKKLLQIGYCKFTKLGNKTEHDMIAVISGTTAIEIVNTLIKRRYITTLQHAGDMGIELCKAELALKNKLEYIQDKDLIID
jgi:dihydropteroate synthase